MGPMSAGHTLEMRGCNATNPATSVVSGVAVGHFGGKRALSPESRDVSEDSEQMIKHHRDGGKLKTLGG